MLKFFCLGDWGWGFGVLGLVIGPNPQSPIPNPHYVIYKSYLNKNNKKIIIIKINIKQKNNSIKEEMEEENSYELLYKIIIIGDTSVGKSNILSRYVKNEFSENQKSTVGVELGIKFLKTQGINTKIQIWDTAGQERYRSITSSYYKGSHGCFIVYDITNESSFESVERWYEHVQKETSKDISIILVGNKCDLENERKVSKEKGEEKAKNLKCAFFETSALSNINIDKIFEALSNNIYEKTGGNKNEEDIDIEFDGNNKGVNLNKDNNDAKKIKCC